MQFFRHSSPKVGLALGSGAAHGLAHIGVLKALKEAAIPIDMIAGTSMGAIIGASFAKDGEITTAEEIVLKTGWKQIARLLDPSLRSLRKGLIRGQRIEELLYSLIGDIEFKDLLIPLSTVAADISTGKEIVTREGSVVDAVRASLSIPGIFIPINLGNKFLVDGGLINPVPTDVARNMGAKFIIAVNVITSPQERKPASLSQKCETPDAPNIFNTLIQSIYIMEYEIIKSRILDADITISPDVSNIEAFDFHKGEEAILAGYEAARSILPKLQGLIKNK